MKEIGRLWNELSDDEKKIFGEKSREDKDRYQEEMSEIPNLNEPILLSSCVTGSGHFKKSKTTNLNYSPLNN